MNEKGKAVRVYSVNQENLDETLQTSFNFILEVASKEKLLDIKSQLEKKLEAQNE